MSEETVFFVYSSSGSDACCVMSLPVQSWGGFLYVWAVLFSTRTTRTGVTASGDQVVVVALTGRFPSVTLDYWTKTWNGSAGDSRPVAAAAAITAAPMPTAKKHLILHAMPASLGMDGGLSCVMPYLPLLLRNLLLNHLPIHHHPAPPIGRTTKVFSATSDTAIEITVGSWTRCSSFIRMHRNSLVSCLLLLVLACGSKSQTPFSMRCISRSDTTPPGGRPRNGCATRHSSAKGSAMSIMAITPQSDWRRPAAATSRRRCLCGAQC
jgi:hypothetical protein